MSDIFTKDDFLKTDFMGGALLSALAEAGLYPIEPGASFEVEMTINGTKVDIRDFFRRLEELFNKRVAEVAVDIVSRQASDRSERINSVLRIIEDELTREAKAIFPEVEFDDY